MCVSVCGQRKNVSFFGGRCARQRRGVITLRLLQVPVRVSCIPKSVERGLNSGPLISLFVSLFTSAVSGQVEIDVIVRADT